MKRNLNSIKETFTINQQQHYVKKNINYQFPLEISHFSYDENRVVSVNDRSGLKYFYEPEKNSDLNSGFPDLFIKREPKLEHLDSLIKCLFEVNTNLKKVNKSVYAPNFCTWRGIIRSLMVTPYFPKDSWELNIISFDNTIFMEENETLERKAASYGETEKEVKMSYYGYKFENIATISKPPSDLKKNDQELTDRNSEAVNTNVQYCSVWKSSLGTNSMILGGEVDCLYSENLVEHNHQKHYAELKTNKVFQHSWQRKSFERYKLLKVWAQSYLAGVPTVIIGFRSDEGILKFVKTYKTVEIPSMVNSWNPHVCLGFLDSILNFIKTNLEDVNDATQIYKLKYDSLQPHAIKLEGPIAAENNLCFLPQYFVNEVSQNKKNRG
ncbi:Dom-3 Z [Clydaea vesicula]|uniref:Decapping nuclease n=1 Tax=Clydaea vesicula TaxID=447962 RepID=A0AAD5U5I4_9FUNG|nr:Dom-3 Z [Clydaea vesicula]